MWRQTITDEAPGYNFGCKGFELIISCYAFSSTPPPSTVSVMHSIPAHGAVIGTLNTNQNALRYI